MALGRRTMLKAHAGWTFTSKTGSPASFSCFSFSAVILGISGFAKYPAMSSSTDGGSSGPRVVVGCVVVVVVDVVIGGVVVVVVGVVISGVVVGAVVVPSDPVQPMEKSSRIINITPRILGFNFPSLLLDYYKA